MEHQDLRTRDEKISDMLAEEYTFDEIASRLKMSVYEVEARFKVICAKVGRQAR